MPKVRIHDLEMYYEVRGKGFPLIMINWYSADSEGWDSFVPMVKELSKHYRVVAPDNRGTGRSKATKGDYSIKIMADDVAGLLDSLRISKANVLGRSMGGMVAQELAINHPKKVNGLILVCTTSRGFAYETSPQQREVHEKLRWMFAPPQGMSQEAIAEEILRLCFCKEFFDENKASIMSFISKYPTPLSTIRKQYDAMDKFYTYDRLRMISSKTLIIHGEDDKILVPDGARTLAKHIPKAELKIFKQAGHSVLEEKWHEAKPVILDFLKNLDAY